ncbi:MAG: type II secretion system F family protein, partial [Proteobacteria bacterium]|nr:type II secretion system F family protein [Pseudomonadota bacterium]
MATAAAKGPKEFSFLWEGKDKTGKTVRGEFRATGEAVVNATLRRQGILVQKVKKQRSRGGGSVTEKDITLFSRQLATMMKAGVPLLQAFDIVGKGASNPAVGRLLMEVKTEVESGASLAASFRKYPLYFDALFCNLVAAGEQAGALDAMLDRLATYREKSEALKGKIRKALTYPLAVLAIALVVSGLLLIKVVPQFEGVFASFGAALPPFTQFVITLSDLARAHYLLVGASTVVGVFGFRAAIDRSPALRDGLDSALLRLPVLGSILTRAALARFARTLATTLGAGVPLVEGLRSAAGATGNAVYRDAVEILVRQVSAGTALAEAMA